MKQLLNITAGSGNSTQITTARMPFDGWLEWAAMSAVWSSTNASGNGAWSILYLGSESNYNSSVSTTVPGVIYAMPFTLDQVATPGTLCVPRDIHLGELWIPIQTGMSISLESSCGADSLNVVSVTLCVTTLYGGRRRR